MGYSIDLQKISKYYGSNRILEDINLNIQSGRILGIIGSNGSGKSTLLKIIIGQLEASEGKIIVSREKKPIDYKVFLEDTAFISPELNLYERLTVWENMELLLGLRGVNADESLFVESLNSWGLNAEVLPKYPSELSTGMAQRVKLAIMSASGADVLIFDEASSNMDESGVNLLLDYIRAERSKGKLIILATNDSREVAIADETFQL